MHAGTPCPHWPSALLLALTSALCCWQPIWIYAKCLTLWTEMYSGKFRLCAEYPQELVSLISGLYFGTKSVVRFVITICVYLLINTNSPDHWCLPCGRRVIFAETTEVFTGVLEPLSMEGEPLGLRDFWNKTKVQGPGDHCFNSCE